MKLFTNNSIETVQLTKNDFLREISMSCFIIENPDVLTLDEDEYSSVHVLEDELHIKDGRISSNKKDGRIDLLIQYNNDKKLICELKNSEINMHHFNQLIDYLNVHENIDDHQINGGLIVGTSISDEIKTKILNCDYKTKNNLPIYAVTIKRYSDQNGKNYIITDHYLPKNTKDATQYNFNGNSYGKSSLVYNGMKHLCEYKDISFDEIIIKFGKTNRKFAVNNINEVRGPDGRKRFNENSIYLFDGTKVFISNQWSINNIDNFISKFNEISNIKI